jgi:carbonic anhydrase
MRGWAVAFVLVMAMCSTAVAATPVASLPADEAMQLLKAGNVRHIAKKAIPEQLAVPRPEELAKPKRQPVATILACSDSHTSLEAIFDQDAGNIFVVRVAGNLAGPGELGSIEYGVERLGTPVVLVLGHTSCGVVSAAVQNAMARGNLSGIINQIKPAVANARAWSPNASGEELLNKSIKTNVWLSMETVLRKSQDVREHVQGGRILVVGGIYDNASGQVTWLGQHPDQSKILAAVHAATQKPRPKPKPKITAGAEAPGEEQGGAEPVGEAIAAPETTPPAKPATKPAAKSVVKPAAKQPAKASAKPAAESATTPEANPNARSEGEGELLAPALDKAPAKADSKTAKGKGTHQ